MYEDGIVLSGQTLFLHRGIMASSINAPRDKGLGEFTVLTHIEANNFCWALIDACDTMRLYYGK